MARTASTSPLWAKLILRNETVNRPKTISQTASTIIPKSLGIFLMDPTFRVLPCRASPVTSQPRDCAEHDPEAGLRSHIPRRCVKLAAGCDQSSADLDANQLARSVDPNGGPYAGPGRAGRRTPRIGTCWSSSPEPVSAPTVTVAIESRTPASDHQVALRVCCATWLKVCRDWGSLASEAGSSRRRR